MMKMVAQRPVRPRRGFAVASQSPSHTIIELKRRKPYPIAETICDTPQYANVRPCMAYAPYIPTQSAGMNVVVIRENEEDPNAVIEYRQTEDVYQCLKLISRSGSERVIRYAFEFAQANGCCKVTCPTKDNIVKITDGLFHRVFDEIAQTDPHSKNEHLFVDHGTGKRATNPAYFDVIVAPNLYGDIVSDVMAEVAGSIDLVGSADTGHHVAMLEAVHVARRQSPDRIPRTGLGYGWYKPSSDKPRRRVSRHRRLRYTMRRKLMRLHPVCRAEILW